jgi:hypothetical protein
MANLPNFLVIGAEKAGTTSLDDYLRQHPQIYMSPMKEPRYFAPEFYTVYYHGPRVGSRSTPMTEAQYHALFADLGEQRAVGEVSPQYLYLPDCAERIYQQLPHAKVVIILRDPVDRAFSAYCYQQRCGFEAGVSFEDALALEEQRVRDHWRPVWHYQHLGLYADQVERYLNLFPKEQVRVWLYDQLRADSVGLAQSVYDFLGVDSAFVPDTSVKLNVSGQPKSRWLQNLLYRDNGLKSLAKAVLPKSFGNQLSRQVRQQNLGAKPTLAPATRARLIERYTPDILRLQVLIHQDLSAWLRP